MAGWGQAIFSGIGEEGSQAGTGITQGLLDAFKVKQQYDQQANQQQQLAQAQQRINLEQSGQKQQYDLAQQQHDLMRAQIERQGWNLVGNGPVKQPDGSYATVYDNPNMPLGSQTRTIPFQGIPQDSMEGRINTMKLLQDQGVDSTRAMEIAFKQSGLYRTDPAGQIAEFQKAAEDMAAKGIKSVPVFGVGNIDITTPEGRAKYGQAMAESNSRNAAAYTRAMLGNGAPSGANQPSQYGWTANDIRDYGTVANQVKLQEKIVQDAWDRSAANTINASSDPSEQAEKALAYFQKNMAPYYKQEEDKRNEIENRVHPLNGQVISQAKWAADPANKGKSWALFAQGARQKGAMIVP